jgi:purine-nucleoside phosphorylase
MAEPVLEAAEAVRALTSLTPRVALILGSGLGDLADEIDAPTRIPFDGIPHFPRPTVPGHVGSLEIGSLQGMRVVAMRGRVHFYEGLSLQAVTFPVRVMRCLGADILIVTNAAGGLNEDYETGDLMLLTDHLNLMGLAGHSPLVGPRFLDMQAAYDPLLRELAQRAAANDGFRLREGVYAMVGGPSYETPAEVRFLQRGGADAVGMSTIPEVIVARDEGMQVLGISSITNMLVGDFAGPGTSHADVLAVAERIRPRLAAVVRGVLASLAHD